MNAAPVDPNTLFKIATDPVLASQSLWTGMMKYSGDFAHPFFIAAANFSSIQLSEILTEKPEKLFNAYLDLTRFNIDLWSRALTGGFKAIGNQNNTAFKDFLETINQSTPPFDIQSFLSFLHRYLQMPMGVEQKLPKAVKAIESDFGFHFENQTDSLIDETDRFLLYQVKPDKTGVAVDNTAKPVFIIPPFVLGTNILGFLPKDKKSYAHAFANKGIPTYIRIMKNILETPALQTMTMEEETLDTRYFCRILFKRHHRKVTLNGYCQGGYSALCHILSGRLDDYIDALITCVAPMDGTKSNGLGRFLRKLPARFNDLSYGIKKLNNGNTVIDGQLMGWVYKLKSIANEIPVAAYLRDMNMVDKMGSVSKTAAALNYWLQHERTDIPVSITNMSFAAYNTPIQQDGTLPVKLFGKPLNLKDMEKKNIPWLLCYGQDDDLVEKEVALAPADFIRVEAVPFPKGHVAIATSWSDPDSAYALDKRFGSRKEYRGPVRFQLDLNDAVKSGHSRKIKNKKSA